jgi:hypothetical protein
MDLFNASKPSKALDYINEDFWQAKTYAKDLGYSTPPLIDIVNPQPKSQTKFFGRVKSSPAKAKKTKRVTRTRKTAGK